MRIAKIDPQAFTWNGIIFAKVYTLGCNFRCGYCFVPELVLEKSKWMDGNEAITVIKRNRVMQGVCVTGGEPTIQKDLPIFLKKLELLNLKIMLETNGSNPGMIEKLVKRNLVDFIRIDVKAPPKKYLEITGTDSWTQVQKSLEILESWDGYWEVVTVWHPGLSKEDLTDIGRLVKGKWVISQFETGKTLNPEMNRNVEIDEEFLSRIEGPREIWVRTREHERKVK